jgi:diguanylate cyclase (GGDEF)-like protein
VTGRDELGELGTALNEMVDQGVKERAREDAHLEFAATMQFTETEEEARQLLVRQIQRLIPDSSVVVLNHDKSANRLEATTPVPADSPLTRALGGAKPGSCLAVRSAHTHSEQPESDALATCRVCGGTAAFSTCEPLLVGSDVNGSVLVSRPRPATDTDMQNIKRCVTQATPVMANLRNLAVAENMAKTDELTGLPNSRNVTETVRRMVAHASRTVSPLAALPLDLDHFKGINDRYGHGTGDEALIAVGAALSRSCRKSDFVGRLGGEEFLVLLLNTGLEAAQVVAESIRATVAAIVLPAIEQAITVSIGIAVIPDHAGDSAELLRNADRALYAAKNNGRDRAETFSSNTPSEVRVPASESRGIQVVARG